MGTAEWSWGGRDKAVAMTGDHAQALVTAIVDAVAEKTRDGVLENYRQMARLEADLSRARDEATRMIADHTILVDRKDAEIIALRSHIAQLQLMLTNLAPNPANFQTSFAPVSAPVYSATVPMPPPPASWEPSVYPAAG